MTRGRGRSKRRRWRGSGRQSASASSVNVKRNANSFARITRLSKKRCSRQCSASAWKDAELGWHAEIEALKQRNAELEGQGAGPRNSDSTSWSGHEAGEIGNDVEAGDDQRGGDGTGAELTKRISSMLGAQIEREFERLDPAIARQQRLWEERERDRRAQETSVTVPDATEQLPVSKQLQFSVC